MGNHSLELTSNSQKNIPIYLNVSKAEKWVCLIDVFLKKIVNKWYKNQFTIEFRNGKSYFRKTDICSYNLYYVNQWKVIIICVFY